MGKRKKGANGCGFLAALLLLACSSLWIPVFSYGADTEQQAMPVLSLNILVWSGLIGLLVAVLAWFVSKHMARGMSARRRPASSGLGRGIAGSPVAGAGLWTHELILSLDGPAYEKLCEAILRLKGLSIDANRDEMSDIVSFYLTAGSSQMRIGAARCHSQRKCDIDVQVVRELQEVMDAQQIEVGLLMYRGTLSKATTGFLAEPEVSINAQGPGQLLDQVLALPTAHQTALMQKFIGPELSRPLSVYYGNEFSITEQS